MAGYLPAVFEFRVFKLLSPQLNPSTRALPFSMHYPSWESRLYNTQFIPARRIHLASPTWQHFFHIVQIVFITVDIHIEVSVQLTQCSSGTSFFSASNLASEFCFGKDNLTLSQTFSPSPQSYPHFTSHESTTSPRLTNSRLYNFTTSKFLGLQIC